MQNSAVILKEAGRCQVFYARGKIGASDALLWGFMHLNFMGPQNKGSRELVRSQKLAPYSSVGGEE